MESSFLSSSKIKRDKLIKNVKYYEGELKKWEAAVFKTEGKKPGKHEMKTAPETIQKAYKEYCKTRKLLKTISSSASPSGSRSKKGSSKGPSPRKIFVKSNYDQVDSKNTTNGILKNKHQGPTSSKTAARTTYSIFQEKLSFALKVLAEKSPAKKHTIVPVLDTETGETIPRKVLIPNRFAKKTTTESSFASNKDQQNTAENFKDEADDISHLINKTKINAVTETNPVWQNFSPKSKVKPKGGRHVDSAWLDRCGSDHENEDNIEAPVILQSEKDELADDLPQEPLYSQSFQDFLNTTENLTKSAETSNCDNNSGSIYSRSPDNEQFDSGLGMSNIVFSTEEILGVIHEVLPATANNVNESMFHSENACSPPAKNFQTIDMEVMDNLLSSSSSPFAQAIAADAKKDPDYQPPLTTKRKAALAFSPSPKKPSPKKKFFKSNRSKTSYKVSSYKPPTPLKSKKLKPTTPTAIKAVKKIPNAAEGSVTRPKIIDPVKNAMDTSSTPTSSKPLLTSARTDNCSESIDNPPKKIQNVSKVDYFDEIAQDPYSTRKGSYKKRKLMPGEGLAMKMKKGKANENFVKIDITKKVFVRGHKKVSGAKAKRNDWKMNKSASSKEEKLKTLICRKCKESGHFAKFCLKDTIPTNVPEQVDESPFPSLEEAATMVNNKIAIKTNRVSMFESQVENVENGQTNSVEADSTPIVACNASKPIEPYFYSEHDLMSYEDEDAILQEAIKKFGYTDFRPGQKEAVVRILKGLSTLLVLSTGTGKSLCYQLPAYMYALKNPGSLAICVSPLVSLMEDQVEGLPGFFQAAFLHSNMPSGQREKVVEKVLSKKLHVLLVSPEAVCGGMFGILRGKDLPQISFACIDEVHCVSQWSHNFRPCYLQLAKILREKLNVRTILGLTATATEYTSNSICETLQIDPSTTIRGEMIPNNLNLTSSRDTYRDDALLTLLRGERFKECESIIIYCTRRDECQRIASLIRTSLQDVPGHCGVSRINSRQRISNNCEAYHAGMSAGKRRLVQQQFMSGKIRIVVATVAFGMGIDKSDIRSVIHYNMPKTFESYVQEIGRAGRDGLPAHCHLFLESVKGRDLSELKRHVYCNSIDRTTLRKFLRRVFQPCKCKRLAELTGNSHKLPSNQRCPGHEISFIIDETVQELDIPQENITTILCYLELDSHKKWIEMLPNTYQTCKIQSYGGAGLLKSAALKCPPLAAAIALKKEQKKFKDTDVYLEFNVIEVASTLGWNSGAVKKELKNLEWTGTNFDNKGVAERFRKSAILVEFCDLAFHATAPGDLTDEECDNVLEYLFNHNHEQEKTQLYQLHRVYQALLSISHNTVESVCDIHDEEKSNRLKDFIHTYFVQKTLEVPPDWKIEIAYSEQLEQEITRDIRDMVASSKDIQFTGRSVARIFQGISSPCFPVEEWGRNRSFWRKHIECDFHYLCKIASQEILRF